MKSSKLSDLPDPTAGCSKIEEHGRQFWLVTHDTHLVFRRKSNGHESSVEVVAEEDGGVIALKRQVRRVSLGALIKSNKLYEKIGK